MKLCRCRWFWTPVVLLLLASGNGFSAQSGQPSKQYDFRIERGSLPSALRQFSQQSGLQVGTQLNVDESATSEIGPFYGHATVDEALTQLLQGSDLMFKWQDENTIRISAIVREAPQSEDGVSTVTVTGSRLPSVDDGPAPIRVYGHRRIDRYGASSVADFSRYLTQQPFAFSPGHLQSGAQFFQMRGLGFDTTLVLLNGRRMPPSANSISLNAVDINNIPLTAVERVEVMSDSASAIYGADAIGGVVNIILKDKVETPEVYLHYGQADGGGAQRRAAVSLGATTDRLKSTLILDYYETAELMGTERDLWRNQDYRRYGGQDYRISTANPGNVYSTTGQPLPGLMSSRAAVPLGATGRLTPSDFLATDGATNLESSFSDWSITPRSQRASGYGSVEYSFGEKLSLFSEILAASVESTALRTPPSISRLAVPASNPFNPFGVPVSVDYSFSGMDRISHVYDTDLLRVVGGGRGKVGQWDWEISGLRHSEDGSNTAHGGIDPARVMAAIRSEDPQTALNVFSDGPAGSRELLASLIGPPQQLSFSFASSQVSAFIRGPIFEVGTQKAELVFGGEWRHDDAGFWESGKRADVGRDISSVFSEMRVPLWNSLSLKIALRADDYGGDKRVVNPQYGLTWKPAKDWLFRAAYGTSFRPPSLFELYMPVFQSSILLADPLRGGEVSNVALVVGGNADLEPVTAQSFTSGFVFNPSAMPGLRIGASYWRVVMDNRIVAPIYPELLKPDSLFSDRVIRESPSGQDVQAGWAGRLRSIDLSRLNYGDLDTSGIDLDTSVQVERDWGCLRFDLAVTWIDEYRSRDMNQVLPSDRVGIANAQGTIPEWRAVSTLGWKLGDFGVSTTTTFIPSYQDADFIRGPLNRRISSQTLVDLQTWIDLDLGANALLDGATLTFGARNLFDKAPEFANVGLSLGYDFSQNELTRRFLYMRLSKRF